MTPTNAERAREALEALAIKCLADEGRAEYANPKVIRAMLAFAAATTPAHPATDEVREINFRALLIEAGRNAGAILSDDVSDGFLKLIPEEVRLKVAAMEKRGAEAVIAYHVAICSPKGVVPDDTFYDASMATSVQSAIDAGIPVRAALALGQGREK